MDENTILRSERIATVADLHTWNQESLLVVNDRTRALQQIPGERWNRFCLGRTQGTSWPTKKLYSGAVIRLDIDKKAMRSIIQAVNSVLANNSPVWIVGGNDEGIKSFSKLAQGLLVDVETLEIKKRCRLLKAKSVSANIGLDQLQEQTTVEFTSGPCEWKYYPGAFSKGTLDAGTELLLKYLDTIASKNVKQIADFACGTGILSFQLRKQFPDIHIDAIEVDSWAMLAAQHNVPDVMHLLSDGWASVANDRRYRLIVSNPPIHIGKETDFSILRGLLQGAISRLHRKGELLLVLQGQVVLPRFTNGLYRICEVVQQDRRYKVWRVSAPHR
jgi:16S rRNA (guanine1207-N2)-methyltransferase